MRTTLGKILLSGTLVVSQHACADDESHGVVLPEIQTVWKRNFVTATNLKIEKDKVNVAIGLNGDDRNDVATITIPRFTYRSPAETYPTRHFPELRIRVNTEGAEQVSTTRAFVGKRDITEMLARAGIDPLTVAQDYAIIPRDLVPKKDFKQLLAIGAISPSSHGYHFAHWAIQRTIRFLLPAGSTSLSLKYDARPAFTMLYLDEFKNSSNLRKYCLTSSDITKHFNSPAESTTFSVMYYTIPASIDSKSPGLAEIETRNLLHEYAENTNWRTLTAYCSPEGTPIVSGTDSTNSRVKTDSTGNIHILTAVEISTE